MRRCLIIFTMLVCLARHIAAASTDSGSAPPGRSVVVDTDAATDDLVAIAMLLSRPELRIEAITVTNGEAHVSAGANNILRLLTLAGRHDIPVYLGRSMPLRGNAAFPSAWRRFCDTLPGIALPQVARPPASTPAADFLARRMLDRNQSPVEILALGPLTNIAEAFRQSPREARRIKSLVVMGGALHVPGNVRAGWPKANGVAEFNIFVDPEAARIVFAADAALLLVPLDATNHIPVDKAFVEELRIRATTPLARFVIEVLDAIRDFVASGTYFAWDPLTAGVFLDRSLATTVATRLAVETSGANVGQTIVSPRGSAVLVAESINTSAFRAMFVSSLQSEAASKP